MPIKTKMDPIHRLHQLHCPVPLLDSLERMLPLVCRSSPSILRSTGIDAAFKFELEDNVETVAVRTCDRTRL
jgi:hypothetical protein